ncbi:hypothetical protein NCCP2222_29750 [Sporosarcina sp. NCCP-2222]|uniref:hypothetical protein n=1 Tax=Sporosarcina sp. NCCP-2222 TaxID=2935073 RepID=UPI00207DE2CC|nr:hypothetical protein [Sporosarcina sp. NCCP-2222]GKV57028.1 hypothetical protein NCCP2222_29750 [Sporosarcina sp. NCCP-2222]
MKSLDEQLLELEAQLHMTDESKTELRTRILQKAHDKTSRRLTSFGWIAVACLVLIFTSPIYSSTAARVVSKIIPLSITSSLNGSNNPDVTSQLFELVTEEGYEVNFIGVTPSPYTVEVSLVLQKSALHQAIKDLEPKITDYLYINGFDKFDLKISSVTDEEIDPGSGETFGLYDQVREIVKKVFTSYGYAKEADYELAGFEETWFSHIVQIDMPDHIQESDQIIEDIEKEIKAQDLDIKEVKVHTFNLKHRQQDNRWAYVASDLYDAMAGKSAYQVTGMSYRVKKGAAFVKLRTSLDQPLSDGIVEEVKNAINAYFELPETKEQIGDDPFTIQFLLKNEKAFITIKN